MKLFAFFAKNLYGMECHRDGGIDIHEKAAKTYVNSSVPMKKTKIFFFLKNKTYFCSKF